MDANIQWLLEGDPWVEYRTRLDLLGQPADDPQVLGARRAMVEHPFIRKLTAELQGWPGVVLNSHKSAGQSFHKLAFAADIGLTRTDPGMEEVISRVMAHYDPDGPFQLPTNVPVHFGGSGQDTWAWALCDAPTTVYALVKFGLADHPRVRQAAEHLAGLARENGWPCAVSRELGHFRGPGRRDDPCPYATLVMLRLLASLPGYRDSEPAHWGAEALLNAWQRRADWHPYIFYMGNDFCKLKLPMVWYDILHVTRVLGFFPWLEGDARLREMREIIRSKADADGRYTPESTWMAWKEWEFGQKKVPSRWLTLQALLTLSNTDHAKTSHRS